MVEGCSVTNISLPRCARSASSEPFVSLHFATLVPLRQDSSLCVRLRSAEKVRLTNLVFIVVMMIMDHRGDLVIIAGDGGSNSLRSFSAPSPHLESQHKDYFKGFLIGSCPVFCPNDPSNGCPDINKTNILFVYWFLLFIVVQL